ncbi:MAG: hypothetical protein RH859_11515 [Longimicrobiales bacterium]
MSNSGDDNGRPERPALQRLEELVGRAVDRLEALRLRAEAAEAKNAELEELVRRFTGDEAEAGRLLSRLRALEADNEDLRDRLSRGRDGVDRILARIRFLEEQR